MFDQGKKVGDKLRAYSTLGRPSHPQQVSYVANNLAEKSSVASWWLHIPYNERNMVIAMPTLNVLTALHCDVRTNAACTSPAAPRSTKTLHTDKELHPHKVDLRVFMTTVDSHGSVMEVGFRHSVDSNH